MKHIHLFLIKYLTNKPKFKLLRDVIFCKYHYDQSIYKTISQHIQTTKHIKARTKADQIYKLLIKQPEFTSITSYVKPETQGTINAILKDSLRLIYTKNLHDLT